MHVSPGKHLKQPDRKRPDSQQEVERFVPKRAVPGGGRSHHTVTHPWDRYSLRNPPPTVPLLHVCPGAPFQTGHPTYVQVRTQWPCQHVHGTGERAEPANARVLSTSPRGLFCPWHSSTGGKQGRKSSPQAWHRTGKGFGGRWKMRKMGKAGRREH